MRRGAGVPPTVLGGVSPPPQLGRQHYPGLLVETMRQIQSAASETGVIIIGGLPHPATPFAAHSKRGDPMIEERFNAIYGTAPEVVVRAPGRVNLIGEHTDYNDGFVLPAAIDRSIDFAGRKRADRTVRLHSLDFDGSVEFSLDDIQKDGANRWSNYVRGVSKYLEEDGHRLAGADIVFGGNVPREAGLSSSAAVEVGTAAFWKKLLGLELDPVYLVKLSRKAENQFVGVPCGIMDQFISGLGRANHALFLDCRDLQYRHVPLRDDVKIVVCNSGVKRALAQSEYEVRLKQCREAVERIASTGRAVASLRDVKPADLEAARAVLSDVLFRRARHVVTENQRVLEAIKVLESGNLERFGELMNASHVSLRDDYEVSSKELDVLVEVAWKQPGVLGARMTGAGFGGCTVNLVRQEAAEAFAEAIMRGYKEALGLKAEVYICKASQGALSV
ncbi:MAG: galactokinase [Terriglobia bacterium]